MTQKKWEKIKKYLSIEYKFFLLMAMVATGFALWRVHIHNRAAANQPIQLAIMCFVIGLVMLFGLKVFDKHFTTESNNEKRN